MGRNYVRARDVLPDALLKAVCEALGGRPSFMWVPAVRNLRKKERNDRVLALHAQGFPVATIADRLFLSERTVWRILARARDEKPAADGANPEPPPVAGDSTCRHSAT